LSLAIPGTALAAPCAALPDQAALQVRMLQTELMVGALTCNQRAGYNAFVARHQPQLAKHGKQLQGFFTRAYSKRELNNFITRIANQSAHRGMVQRGDFCRNTGRLHTAALSIEPAQLPVLASSQPFSDLHGITPCSTQVAQKQPAGKAVTK